MKKTLLLLSIIITSTSIAQEIENDTINEMYKSKLVSIGAKIGIPNVVSLNGEITLPFLNNHFAPYIDYGAFNLDIEDQSCPK